MLTAIIPADDYALFSEEQMRVAYGLAGDDTSQDALLASWNLQVSQAVAVACKIRSANGSEPTLRRETLRETLLYPFDNPLFLSRRHKITIISVTEDVDDPLLTTFYEVDQESGALYRLDADGWRIGFGAGRRLSIIYEAGFAAGEAPADILSVLTDIVRSRKSEASRDPMEKRRSVRVDGIEEISVDYWVNSTGSSDSGGSSGGGSLPAAILGRLGRYRNYLLA